MNWQLYELTIIQVHVLCTQFLNNELFKNKLKRILGYIRE